MRYAKFIIAAATAGLVALGAAITDDKVTNSEWIAIALATLGALGVWAIPNRPAVTPPADGRVMRTYDRT